MEGTKKKKSQGEVKKGGSGVQNKTRASDHWKKEKKITKA